MHHRADNVMVGLFQKQRGPGARDDLEYVHVSTAVVCRRGNNCWCNDCRGYRLNINIALQRVW
jgi:hypothetical protein